MRTIFCLWILAILAAAMPAGAAATLKTLYAFQGSSDGGCPTGPVQKDANGNLFVTAGCGGTNNNGTVVELSPPATVGGNWTLNVLATFDGGYAGGTPGGGVIPDGHGGYWGTNYNGGLKGWGTIYDLRPPTSTNLHWRVAVRWNFGLSAADGRHPNPGLVSIGADTVAGTAIQGGKHGLGTVFSLGPPRVGNNGDTETILWNFTGGSDGGNPVSPPVFANNVLYGATTTGGVHGFGTIYMLSPSAGGYQLTTLYNFTGGVDGGYPEGKLLLNGGNLYGICESGGGTSPAIGTVWRLVAPTVLHKSGWTFQKMWQFTGGLDGAEPIAGISRIGSTFYTSGYYRGLPVAGAAYGALIALNRTGPNTWSETNILQFNQGNGANPGGTLTPGPSGTLYGTTVSGILYYGQVFQLTP